MIYLAILLIIVYCVYKYDVKRHRTNAGLFYWSLCIIFILLGGLRYKIGGDTLGYMNSWDFYPNFWNLNWFHDIEQAKATNPEFERYHTGWFLYIMALKGIVDDYYISQIVTAVLLNIAIFTTIKKYSLYPFITLLIFFLNFKFLELEFEVMRESLAISMFLLLAFDSYMNKKWIHYYIGTTIAYFIHPSAIGMFILPFLRNLNWNFKTYSIVFVATSLSIGIAGRIILGDLLNLIGGDGYTSEYASNAIAKEYNTGYILMYLFQPVLMYILIVSFRKKILQRDFIPLIFFSIFFLNLSLVYFTASRLANYIIIIDYIAISPIFYSLIKKFRTVWIAVLLMTIYLVPTFYQFIKDPTNRVKYFPYQNIIFPDRTQAQKDLERWHFIK